MKQASRLPVPTHLFYDGRRVRIRIPGMGDERQTGLARSLDMIGEACALHIPRTLVVMVIQPGLANADDLWMLGPADDLLDRQNPMFFHAMRVMTSFISSSLTPYLWA